MRIILLFLCLVFISPTLTWAVDASPVPPIEDILYRNRLITEEEWKQLRETRIQAQRVQTQPVIIAAPTSKSSWADSIKVFGYGQFRYAMPSNDHINVPLGDKNATDHPRSLYMRRIRVVFSGDFTDALSFYFQPAFEGNGFALNNAEIVDMYGDWNLTSNKQHRFRFGLQRVPNAFDTYRSSSQRQELDRSESIQSGAPGERDLGISYFWTSEESQRLYQRLKQEHNGPGDYGNLQLMIYNGQGRNQTELNADKHIGLGLQYPVELADGRLMQVGLLGYHGQYVVAKSGAMKSSAKSWCESSHLKSSGCQFLDERITAYIWLPPQPWGLLTEVLVGRGPIRDASGVLHDALQYGGYTQVNYKWVTDRGHVWTPYVRYGAYRGGLKSLIGANGNAEMLNLGLIWEPSQQWRVVTEWLWKRGYDQVNFQSGHDQSFYSGNLLRLQIQWFWR